MYPSDETKEQAAQRIFERRAAFYATSPLHTESAVLDQVAAWSQAQSDWLALDVATGAGHTAFAIAERARHVVATDLTRAMLEQAATLANDRNLQNLSFAAADAHDLPFPDDAFDLLSSRRAPHHFSHIEAALAEFRRVLRKGGRIVIDDRSVPEDDPIDELMNRLDWYHDESHVRQYRPSEWRSMLGKAGFDIDRVEPYTRHRPLSTLTNDVAPENVAIMHTLLDALPPAQQAQMGYETKNGEPYITHWFVMIAATAV